MKIKLFCKHNYLFDSNIYGDWVIQCGYNRSIWKCEKCGKYIYNKKLIDSENYKRFQKIRKIENNIRYSN